jgi:hypothetical protein
MKPKCIIVGQDGPPCPRCRCATEIREHHAAVDMPHPTAGRLTIHVRIGDNGVGCRK